MYEKRWRAIAPRLFTANGTSEGVITVASTKGFHVKQEVRLTSSAFPGQQEILQVKDVLSSTQLVVGPAAAALNVFSDVSGYLVANSAAIRAYTQNRPAIPQTEHERAVYEEEPVVAKRVILVDELGEKFSESNPVPVQLSDGSINIGSVNAELEVQLSHRDNDPDAGDVADSVRIGDGQDELAVNSDGSINVIVQNSLSSANVINVFDEVGAVPAAVQTTILTYVVPGGQTLKLKQIEVGGENIAEYEVIIGGNVEARKRTWFSGPFTQVFNFKANALLEISSGTVILVKVLHNRPTMAKFEARLLGELQ